MNGDTAWVQDLPDDIEDYRLPIERTAATRDLHFDVGMLGHTLGRGDESAGQAIIFYVEGDSGDGTVIEIGDWPVVADVPNLQTRWSQLRDQIDKLSNLKDDWNSYGAEAPNPLSLQSARVVLDRAQEMALLPDGVMPSVEGGVVLFFKLDDRTADIECFNDGDVLAMTSEPSQEPNVWPVRYQVNSIDEALGTLRAFLGR